MGRDPFDAMYASIATAVLIAAAILLIAWAIRAVARKKLAGAPETERHVDDVVLALADRTKLFLLLLPAVFAGARALTLPSEAMAVIRTGAILSMIAQGALWGSGLVDQWLQRYRRRRGASDPSAVMTINAFRFAAAVGIWAIAIVAAIDSLGFEVSALVAGLGIGGVAVALATQNILGDLFASLSIVIDKPFVVGDFIIIDNYMGTVEHIGLKTTRIRSLDGEQIIFSNSDLLKTRLRNYKRMRERRVVFPLRLSHETPPEQVAKVPGIIKRLLEGREHVRFERSHFHRFGESSLDVETIFWMTTPDYNAYMDVQQALNLALMRALDQEGIEFAFPTRTLMTVAPLQVEDAGADADGEPAESKPEPAPERERPAGKAAHRSAPPAIITRR